MKESEFIDQNKDKWYGFEKRIEKSNVDPDELRNIFIEITDDLSYSRSKYPNRSVRVYLNQLARQIFDRLSKRQKLSLEPIIRFYRHEVPHLMYLARTEMFISLFVFILAVLIGVYSSHQDPEFARIILGDHYVDMTSANIDANDPMAVYRTGRGMESFLRILLNNAQIDIMVLGFGLLFGVGALFVLIRNGIMLGVFQYYFYQHGGFQDSLLTIWLHGTIEISTIALMGGVGLLAGKGLLFPGSYSRAQAFRLNASRAAKLLLGVLPFTVVAAVIEGFITRQTGAPDAIKLIFILICLAVVVFYFVYLPWRQRTIQETDADIIHLAEEPWVQPALDEIHNYQSVLSGAFGLVRRKFFTHVIQAFIASIVLVLGILLFWREAAQNLITSDQIVALNMLNEWLDTGIQIADSEAETWSLLMRGFQAFVGVIFVCFSVRVVVNNSLMKDLGFAIHKGVSWPIGILFSIEVILPYMVIGASGWIVLLIFLSQFVFLAFAMAAILKKHFFGNRIEVGRILSSHPLRMIGLMFILMVLTIVVSFLFNSSLSYFFLSFLKDLLPFGTATVQTVMNGLLFVIRITISFTIYPLILYALMLQIGSIVEEKEAPSLKKSVETIQLVKP
ncbi:MAG: stage II sporulation protein M [Bacteroidetes bacterium]|nr:stage II sporulation protein M [Bacteroidota bacterium]